MKKIRSKRNLIKKILLSLVVTCIALFIAEIVLRGLLRASYVDKIGAMEFEYLIPTPSSPLIFKLKSNYTRTARIWNSDEAPTWTFSTNSRGFRDIEDDLRDPSAQRVLVLGDSYTFGWCVDQEPGSYAHRLKPLLSEKLDGQQIEVFNCGVPAYNTDQEAHLLEDVNDRINPKVVVLGYVMNDAEPQSSVPYPPDEEYRFSSLWLWETAVGAAKQHGLWGARHLTNRMQAYSNDYLAGFSRSSQKWRVSRDALSRISLFCERRSIPLIVAILPDVTQPLDKDYPLLGIHRRISWWVAEDSATCIDLLGSVASIDYRELQVKYRHEGHPNGRAHDLFARALAPLVAGKLGKH